MNSNEPDSGLNRKAKTGFFFLALGAGFIWYGLTTIGIILCVLGMTAAIASQLEK